jgi:hypothetical protein
MFGLEMSVIMLGVNTESIEDSDRCTNKKIADVPFAKLERVVLVSTRDVFRNNPRTSHRAIERTAGGD